MTPAGNSPVPRGPARRPTRVDAGGRAFLDLQNLARREGRQTQTLLVMYVLERFLARLAVSDHADRLILKGGMLLAVWDARRATVDADFLARNLHLDQDEMLRRVVEIASLPAPLPVVLAEKLCTAVELGEGNSRVRDHADIWTLTRSHDIAAGDLLTALEATSAHRGVTLRPLANVLGDYGTTRGSAFTAYRRRLGPPAPR